MKGTPVVSGLISISPVRVWQRLALFSPLIKPPLSKNLLSEAKILKKSMKT